MNQFSKKIIDWQKKQGRNNLPWQKKSAYEVWISEIMLQQTQVETVIPYYETFIKTFPEIKTLAKINVLLLIILTVIIMVLLFAQEEIT